tara:strand:- start:1123 stop:1461 length:339 start_codon:yes stop_codon:yes gene_type:complete
MFKIVSILFVAVAAITWLAQFFLPAQGIGVATGLAIFLVTWWIVLFAILPIGVRGQFEDGDVIEGSEPGAPIQPQLLRKAWWTTVAASVVWLVIFSIVEFGLIDIESLPFPG